MVTSTSLLLICIFNLSHSTIIVSFNSVGVDFLNKVNKEYAKSDPLDTLTLRSRQLLCNIILTTKYFLSLHGKAGYEPYQTRILQNKLLENINAQPSWSTTRNLNVPQQYLQYKVHRKVRVKNSYVGVKILYCMKNIYTPWYISFGFVPKFLYLFETKQQKELRSTAIIEPSAKIISSESRQLNEYFLNQVSSLSDRPSLELVCKIKSQNYLRVCSSVYDVLTNNGYLQESVQRQSFVNYVRLRYKCLIRKVIVRSSPTLLVTFSLRLRPCLINTEDPTKVPQFYLLTDIEKQDSLFVLLPENEMDKTVKLEVRVEKIGALLNPFENGK